MRQVFTASLLGTNDFDLELAEVVMFVFVCSTTFTLLTFTRALQGGDDFVLQVVARQNCFLTRVLGVGDDQGL